MNISKSAKILNFLGVTAYYYLTEAIAVDFRYGETDYESSHRLSRIYRLHECDADGYQLFHFRELIKEETRKIVVDAEYIAHMFNDRLDEMIPDYPNHKSMVKQEALN